MDVLLFPEENVSFEKRNKFASQKIRKKYIEQHNIRRKKSKNYNKHKIRKNSFVRQSLKTHINDDFENYDYNYNLSKCSCGSRFNVNHFCICSQCLQLENDASADESDTATKPETKLAKESKMWDLVVRKQTFKPYFGYDYRLSKTKRSKWNIKTYIENYRRKHGNYDLLYLLLDGIFHQSIYPRFLFFPNDIYNLIAKYVFGTFGTFTTQESKRAVAGIYWFANTINDVMNNPTNQCEFEHNNNNNNKSRNHYKKTFNILNFMYVGGNTLADILLSNAYSIDNIMNIDIVLDTYQLSRHFEQHLKLYHSNKHTHKPTLARHTHHHHHHHPTAARSRNYNDNNQTQQDPDDDEKNNLENDNCKCIFWKYYYNSGDVVSYFKYWTYNKLKFDSIMSYDRYVCKHKYTINAYFILYLFREITFKINNKNWTVDRRDRHREHYFLYYNTREYNLRVRISCFQENCKIEFKRKYIYNGFNLKNITFRIFNGDYDHNINLKRDHYCRLYTNREIFAIERYIANYVDELKTLKAKRRNKERNRRKSISKELNENKDYIMISVPLYPFKLEISHNYSTINSMYVDLNSFVLNDNIDNSKCNYNYNLRELISQWKCNYNSNIYEINKNGLLDIERKAIIAPNINLINRDTIVIYFWKLVEYCEKLIDRQEINLWHIDNRYLSAIEKYCQHNNNDFWDLRFEDGRDRQWLPRFEAFVEKVLAWNIDNFDKYYPQLKENSIEARMRKRYRHRRRNTRKRRRSSTWRRSKRKYKPCCCYYKMKIDNHHNSDKNDINNNIKQNVFFNRFKVFEYLGFDKMLKSKIKNDNKFRKIFIAMIGGSRSIFHVLPMRIELNYCLLQFDYLKYIKYDLKQLNASSHQYSGYSDIHACRHKFVFKIDDIIEYCQARHKDHATLSPQEEKRAKLKEIHEKKKEMKQLVFNDWYYFGRYSEINTWLIDVKNFAKKKRGKKLNDIYCKQINFRKKKNKRYKLFKQTKKVSKRRSKHEKIMDKKKNTKSKRQKYHKQNLMSIKEAYAQDYV